MVTLNKMPKEIVEFKRELRTKYYNNLMNHITAHAYLLDITPKVEVMVPNGDYMMPTFVALDRFAAEGTCTARRVEFLERTEKYYRRKVEELIAKADAITYHSHMTEVSHLAHDLLDGLTPKED